MFTLSKNRGRTNRQIIICVRGKIQNRIKGQSTVEKCGSQPVREWRFYFCTENIIFIIPFVKNFYTIPKKKKKGKEKKKDSLKLFENYFIAKLVSRKIKLSQSIISAMLKLFHHQRIAIYSIHKAKLHSGEIIEVTNRLPITFSLGKIRNGGRGGNRQISRSRSRSGVSKMIKNVNCQGGRNSKRLEERATVKLWLSIVDNSSIRISHFFF